MAGAQGLRFARTLVDEWRRAGITDAVVSPGSRSTPLAVAVAEGLRTSVILDERSASFTALGLALASCRPTVVVCTSGTAAAEFHPAVLEASQAGVPLIVCTADRPPELHGVGAPQTADQVHLYGNAVRWFADPGPPEAFTEGTWRSLAARAVSEATGPRPGPVHLNLAFREPLLDATDEPALPPARHDGGPWHRSIPASAPTPPSPELVEICAASVRPLVIAGHGAPEGLHLERVPILSDHRGPLTGTVPHWDLLLRDHTFRKRNLPDLVVRTGLPPASKALHRWLATLDVPQIALPPSGLWIDPDHVITWMLDRPTTLHLAGTTEWNTAWADAGTKAAAAIDSVLASHPEATEPQVARALLATRDRGSCLVVSSSMPIRDLETFAAPRAGVRVLANRGVNGIDGVVSTAIGVGLAGVPTTLFIGDLALLHDQGALTGLATRGIDLHIVVVDNSGGGIFSFLPQHDLLESDRFEQLFGTPQAIDLAALFALHGIPSTVVERAGDVDGAFAAAASAGGVRATIVATDRPANRLVHDDLATAVAAAITPSPHR